MGQLFVGVSLTPHFVMVELRGGKGVVWTEPPRGLWTEGFDHWEDSLHSLIDSSAKLQLSVSSGPRVFSYRRERLCVAGSISAITE